MKAEELTINRTIEELKFGKGVGRGSCLLPLIAP